MGKENFKRYARLTAHGYCYISPHLNCCVCDGTLNPLNAELNPIRHLLALVGARHFVHVSRIMVKGLHPPSYTKLVQIT